MAVRKTDTKIKEIKKGRGGARAGAGRKKLESAGGDRAKHSLYCSEYELLLARTFLNMFRERVGTEFRNDHFTSEDVLKETYERFVKLVDEENAKKTDTVYFKNGDYIAGVPHKIPSENSIPKSKK